MTLAVSSAGHLPTAHVTLRLFLDFMQFGRSFCFNSFIRQTDFFSLIPQNSEEIISELQMPYCVAFGCNNESAKMGMQERVILASVSNEQARFIIL